MRLITNTATKFNKILLIDTEGKPQEMSLKSALALADEMGLNLVIVAEKEIPVCKILDYQKEIYTQKKKAKKAFQKPQDIKTLKFSLNISEHDILTKVNQGLKFLEKGDKLKVVVQLRGREITHTDRISKLLDYITPKFSGLGITTTPLTYAGRDCYIIISPR